MNKQSLILFLLAALVNLYATLSDSSLLNYLSKPLLLISLGVGFYLAVGRPLSYFARCILAGFFFSFLGDVLLMFTSWEPLLFLAGLGAFLVAHICYIIGFWVYPKKGWTRLWIVLPFGIYYVLMLVFLWPGLDAILRIAVPLYSLVIVGMGIGAYNMFRKGALANLDGQLLFIGALLFIISDSLIALNKFRTDIIRIEPAGFWIMLTYISAQYLIARGAFRADKALRKF